MIQSENNILEYKEMIENKKDKKNENIK